MKLLHLGARAFWAGRWHQTAMGLNAHHKIIDLLHVLQDSSSADTSSIRVPCATGTSRFAVVALDVKKRFGGLGIAERDLAQTAFDHELWVLRLVLGRLYRSLNLLLHALEVILSRASVSAHAAVATAGLEQICLGKIAQWLTGVLPLSGANGTVDLVVEVLG